ncbi:MAG: hypothetical protein ABIG61_03915 [Planctomycetota bacterium]
MVNTITCSSVAVLFICNCSFGALMMFSADQVTSGAEWAPSHSSAFYGVLVEPVTDTNMPPYNPDINQDGIVDLRDFSIMAEYWLQFIQ